MEQNPSDSDTNPFRYCGEYYDSEIGQIYLRARYYDPTVGRFTQSDPARDGINWYVYCSGDPVNNFDPLGLSDDDIIEEVLLRPIIEKNGGTVTYDANTGTITASIPGYAPIPVQGRIINGRTIVTSKFLMDNFALSKEAATHQPGDTYETMEDLVLAFGLKYLQRSIAERQEYGALIKKSGNRYYYDRVLTSENTYGIKREELSNAQRNSIRYNENEWSYGKVHIHWNQKILHPEMGGENFSPGDLKSKFPNEILYLIGPFGLVRKAVQYNTQQDQYGYYSSYYEPEEDGIFHIYQ